MALKCSKSIGLTAEVNSSGDAGYTATKTGKNYQNFCADSDGEMLRVWECP